MRYLEDAARREPDSGFGLALLSSAYAQCGRFEEAAATAQSAVAHADGEAIIYLLAGEAMVRARRWEQAHAYLAATVRLVPDDPRARSALGMIESHLGNGKR